MIYRDYGQCPASRGRPDARLIFATDDKYAETLEFYGYYLRGGCMMLYPANGYTAGVYHKHKISCDLIRPRRFKEISEAELEASLLREQARRDAERDARARREARCDEFYRELKEGGII